MISATERDRLCIVLVGARNPGNIGAAARAMQDFGFTDLRYVNDYAVPLEAAQLEASAKAAVGASAVLAAACVFSSVAEAVADCTTVVGTTAVGERLVEHPLLPLTEAVGRMHEALTLANGRVGLLFGSEKTGLTRDQLSHCNWLTTIPMFQPHAARHLSMNLGQSIAVCLYELVRSGFEGARSIAVSTDAPATAGDRERLTRLLLETMRAIEYDRRFPANAQEHQVRQLAQTLGDTHARTETWMGIFRQVLWKLSGRARADG